MTTRQRRLIRHNPTETENNDTDFKTLEEEGSECSFVSPRWILIFSVPLTLLLCVISNPLLLTGKVSFSDDDKMVDPVTTLFPKKSNRTAVPYKEMQACLDHYTSQGRWEGRHWRVPPGPLDLDCGFPQSLLETDAHLQETLSNIKVGFIGDSTTRSDLLALEEHFGWPRTDLHKGDAFQKKIKGKNVCLHHEQSFDLNKCGIPPIINTGTVRYFYKVYPYAPLDQYYFENRPELFADLDVLVISLGRWFNHHPDLHKNATNVASTMEIFLTKLRSVFSGTILYQSEYPGHTVQLSHAKYRVQCPHGLYTDANHKEYDCVQEVTEGRPRRDTALRRVMERHEILYLDRWNLTRSLPLDYYQEWLCHKPSFHMWFCNHHLGFVALQHFYLLLYVLRNQMGGV